MVGSGPVAVWVEDAGEAAEAVSADVVVIDDDTLAASLGTRAVLFAHDGVDVEGLGPVPGFVRARWRRRAGLPEPLVVNIPDGSLPDHLVPTALALCSLATVGRRWLPVALALGTPMVDGSGGAASRRARPPNLSDAAAEVAERLGLMERKPVPLGAVARCLAELGTPPGSPVVADAAAALAGIPSLPLPAVTGRHPALEAELVRQLADHLGCGGSVPSTAWRPPLAGRLVAALARRLSPTASRAVERLVAGQARRVSDLQAEVRRLSGEVARLDAELELLRAERRFPS